jgi:hypothetical protein
MYYELTWLGVVLSVVGAAALGVPFARFIARAVRNRDSARKDRGSLSRRGDRGALAKWGAECGFHGFRKSLEVEARAGIEPTYKALQYCPGQFLNLPLGTDMSFWQ